MVLTNYPAVDDYGNELVQPGKLATIDLDQWLLYQGNDDQSPDGNSWIESMTGKVTAMVIGCDAGLCFYKILLNETVYWISVSACLPLRKK